MPNGYTDSKASNIGRKVAIGSRTTAPINLIMPDISNPLSATVQITNQQAALDALRAKEAQPLDADLQAQAEKEVALEFARAGKLAPSDGEFDDATQDRLEQFRTEARLRLEQEAQARGQALPTLPTVPPRLTPAQTRQMGPEAVSAYNAARPAAIGQYYQAIADLRGGGAPAYAGADYASKLTFSAPADAGESFSARSFNSDDMEAEAVNRGWRGPLAPNKESGPDVDGAVGMGYGGDGGGGGSNPAREARMEGGGSHAAGGGPPRDKSLNNPDDYDAIMQRRRDVETDQRNQYSVAGRFGELGTEAANRERLEAYQAGGIATSKELESLAPEEVASFGGRAAKNLKGMLKGQGAYALAYGAGSFLEDEGRIAAQQNDGQYYTPEQRQTQQATSYQAIGTVAGAVIGGVFGEPIIGAGIGGGIGSVAQAFVGANDQRDQDVRQTNEQMQVAMGSLRDFSQSLRDASAVSGELKTALTTLSNAGPGVGEGTIAGADALSSALGERYNPALSGATAYLAQNPILQGLTPGLAAVGGNLPSRDLGGLSVDAAFRGDWKSSNDYAALEQGASQNPKWLAAKQTVDRYNKETDGQKTGYNYGPGIVGPDEFAAAQKQLDEQPEHTPAAIKELHDNQKARTNAIDLYYGANSAQEQAKTRLALVDSRMSVLEASGASDATLQKAAQGVFAASHANTPALRAAGAGIDAYLTANPNLDAHTKADLQAQRDVALTDAGQLDAASAGTRRTLFERSFGTEAAKYSLTETRSQLEGRSAADIQQATNRQSHFLEGTADNPKSPLGDAERQGLREQALKLRYSAQQSVFQENLTHDDNLIGKAELGVTKARGFGSAEDVYTAQGGEIDGFKSKITELTAEMRRGGQSVADYARESRELSQAQGQVSQLTAQRRDERLAANSSIDSSQISIDTAGLSRAVSIGGSAAIPQAGIDADYDKSIKDKQAAVNAYVPGDPRRKAAEAEVASLTTAKRAFDDDAEVYRPDADTRIADIRGEGSFRRSQSAFQRAELAPYSEEGGNPLTRANELSAAITQDEKRRTANFGLETARRTELQGKMGSDGKPLWGKPAEEAYTIHQEQFNDALDADKTRQAEVEHDKLFAFGRMLPEVEAGGGGGIGSAVVTYAALSASFGASSPYTGSWAHSEAPAHGVYGGSGGYGGAAAAHGTTSPAGHPAIAGTPYTPMDIENGMDATGRHTHTEGGLIDGKMLHDLHRQHSAATLLDTGQDVSVLTGQVLDTHRRAPAHSDLSGKLLERHHTDAFSLATGKPISLSGQSGVPYLPSHQDIEHPAVVGGSRGAGVMAGGAVSTEGGGNLANRFGIWAGNPADFTKAHPNVQAGRDVGAHDVPFHAPSGSDSNAQMIALLSRIAQALESHPRPSATVPQAHGASILGALSSVLNAHKMH